MIKWMLSIVLCCGVAIAGLACDESPSGKPSAGTAGAPSALPANLALTTAPAAAQEVSAVRASAKDGEKVVIRGTVAGRADPIADNRAIFTLLDSKIRTCDQMPGDECATPWDACCEPADVLAANVATVQVVDGEGKLLHTSLKGMNGLEPLKRVVVVGIFKPSPDWKAATVNAQGIYVE